MGAWGEGPFDNDTAGDWLYETKIWMKISKALDRVGAGSGNYKLGYTSESEEARAAIELMLIFSQGGVGPGDPDLLHDALGWLDALIQDGEFVEGWKNKPKIERELSRQRIEVKELLTKVRRKR